MYGAFYDLVGSKYWKAPQTLKDIAYTGQLILEEKVLEILEQLHIRYPNAKKIALAGGVFANVKLNKRTSKYLLEYPELDKIPFQNLIDLVSEGVVDKSVLNAVLEQAKTDPNSSIIVKEIDGKQILIDSNSFLAYKIEGDTITKIPFSDEAVQTVFAQEEK